MTLHPAFTFGLPNVYGGLAVLKAGGEEKVLLPHPLFRALDDFIPDLSPLGYCSEPQAIPKLRYRSIWMQAVRSSDDRIDRCCLLGTSALTFPKPFRSTTAVTNCFSKCRRCGVQQLDRLNKV